MTFQFASDLHIEFPENREFLRQHPIQPVADVLILAGDVVPFTRMHEHESFFDLLSEQFQEVYWIPGNHEYYHSKLESIPKSIHRTIRHNVFLVNNLVRTIGSVRFVFSTLWSNISPINAPLIESRLSDFRTIQVADAPFTVVQFNALHRESLAFLQETLQQPHDGPTVVVTHHVPTCLNYPEKFKGDAFNEAFAVELFDFIAENGPDGWIFGHNHNNLPEFAIGKTRMLTNQLGYVAKGENIGFSGQKTCTLEA